MISSETILLSTAIRKGAKLRPQGFESYFSRDSDGTWYSCALGAAYEAAGGKVTKKDGGVEVSLLDIFPELYEATEETDGPALQQSIIELNDIEHMSRETIADQVEAWGY